MKERVTKISGNEIHRSTAGIDLLGRTTGMVSRAPDPANGGLQRVIASVGHGYDSRNRRANARREDGTLWTYGYNTRSEVTSAVKSATSGQSFGYSYDAMGNRLTSTVGTAPSAGTTTYTPNALNQYASINTPPHVNILSRSPDPVTATVTQPTIPIAILLGQPMTLCLGPL